MSEAHATRAGVASATFVVATSCPSCGAPLDFGEASNAVRCAHCASVLLVTGRRRILSYSIAARIAPSEARALAGFTRPAGRDVRVGAPHLLFVPYHRVTGEELFWRRNEIRRERPDASEQGEDLGDRVVRALGGSAPQRTSRWEVELAGRAIERNFLACEASEIASWSLGVRPTVLRLELFQRSALEEQGTVVPPSIAGDAALAHALAPQGDDDLVGRDVLRTVLSVIYFPLWAVEAHGPAGTRLVVVDAVTGAVVAREASPAALERLGGGAAGADRMLGFRPLCCPNCGWDLPVRPDDVVFHCASCERTWELAGEELEPIPSDVVAARPGAVRLPFWQVDAQTAVEGGAARLPQHLWAPAFRWRVKKALCDLGARLSRRAPDPEAEPTKAVPLVGCSLDRQDATTLARLVAQHLAIDAAPARYARPGAKAPRVELTARTTRLLWLPFTGDAYSLRCPFTGSALPRRAVEELLGTS